MLYDRRDYERWAAEHPDYPISRPMLREQLEYMLGEFETPTVDEGFTSVRCVQEDIPNTIDVSE